MFARMSGKRLGVAGGTLALLFLLQSCGDGGDEASVGPQPVAAVRSAQRIDSMSFPYKLALSRDGSVVAYSGMTSDNTGLPPNPSHWRNVYLYSVASGARTLVTVDPAGTSAGNNDSYEVKLSADGRFAIFQSHATNLVPEVAYPPRPPNNCCGGDNPPIFVQVFARELATGKTQLVSIDPSGMSAGNGDTSAFAVSADGRFVAFSSQATNLVPDVTYSPGSNVFVRDLVTGTTELISISADGSSSGFSDVVPYASSSWPAMSDDGRYVVFSSPATNLVTGITYPRSSTGSGPYISNIYLRDRALQSTRILSLSQDGTQASSGLCREGSASITPDGAMAVFTCRANNLIPGVVYPSDPQDVYAWRRDSGALTLVSHSADGTAASNNGAFALTFSGSVVSADGRFVVFSSGSSNLVTGITYFTGTYGGPNFTTVTYGISNAFRWDRSTGTVQLLTRSRDGMSGADFDTGPPVISDDGQVVAFWSGATNITVPELNPSPRSPLALWTADTNAVALASVDASNLPMGSGSGYMVMSGNGKTIAFQLGSSNYIFKRTDSTLDRGGDGR
jgi:hypothetical protein